MYFNDKNSTNIDDEFEKENILFKLFKFISKYKIIIIVFMLFIISVIVIVSIFNNGIILDGNSYYLELSGDEEITIYIGSDYIEPGYDAYNSKNEDMNSEVKINSNLDTTTPGEYTITYTIGEITKTRKVTVIAKPTEYAYIYLKTVNNSVNVYIKLGEDYVEPGYTVFSSTGKNLASEVTVTGSVDTSKKGSYKLIYSLVDSNGVTVSATRSVIVMDSEINLSLSNDEYTNKDITIDIGIIDNYFDYVILPDGNKVTENTYSYKVSENGTYTFTVFTTKGTSKETSITVKNIDKVMPNGSCTLDYNNGSVISVTASDTSGIKKYVYNGEDYFDDSISVSSYIDNADVTIYDGAGNSKIVSCKSVALPLISNITNDGVIVTVKAKKLDSNISGYYFSYTNKRPDKNSGYIATSNDEIEVVRLPGTTYVWVEDESGKISKPMTIKLDNSVIPFTRTGYPVLNGTSLGTHIKNKGGSLSELNKLIARSVRAAGLYTKNGAATAAVALQIVLIQKYNIKISYRMGGKSNVYGASEYWGMYKENPTYEKYIYAGLDCGGFVNWSYKNTGVVWNDFNTDNYYYWDGIEYSKNNGEVGDVLRRFGSPGVMQHVAIIVAKTDDAFVVAEAVGLSNGVVISEYPYDYPNGYEIIKGEDLLTKYRLVSNNEYPSGF